MFNALDGSLEDVEVRKIFKLLHHADPPYVNVYFGGDFWPAMFTETDRGLQETSGWPRPGDAGSDQVGQLLAALDEKIDSDETPEEEKGRLRRIRDSVGEASRDIVVGVLTSYASRATGGG